MSCDTYFPKIHFPFSLHCEWGSCKTVFEHPDPCKKAHFTIMLWGHSYISSMSCTRQRLLYSVENLGNFTPWKSNLAAFGGMNWAPPLKLWPDFPRWICGLKLHSSVSEDMKLILRRLFLLWNIWVWIPFESNAGVTDSVIGSVNHCKTKQWLSAC